MQKYADLVELEKCCQTRIFLQNFVLIQPRTGPLNFFQNFAKIWKICQFCGSAPCARGAGRDARGAELHGRDLRRRGPRDRRPPGPARDPAAGTARGVGVIGLEIQQDPTKFRGTKQIRSISGDFDKPYKHWL